MKKSLILMLKALLLAVVVGWVGWELYKAWRQVEKIHVQVDWRWGALSVAGFCASMLTSGLVWRWLAWKMGDRGPTLRLMGAYMFSQMGKYVPGKVMLILMRVERTGRLGMSAGVCTLSTLLENALFMVSGGLVGTMAIMQVAGGLEPGKRILVWAGTLGGVIVLGALCVPTVFYGLVNRLLRRMRKAPVPEERRLGAGTLALAVMGFFPCWVFGGLALWGSVQAVQAGMGGIALMENWWFAGAFALGVIVGMASLLPGGAGMREALLLAAVTISLMPAVGRDKAVILAGVVAVLQRVFQLVAEGLLGLWGMWVTRGRSQGEMPAPEPAE